MSFEEKYLKYKNKYMALQAIYLNLSLREQIGGACNPPPIPTNQEPITLKEYSSIPENRLISLGPPFGSEDNRHCFDIITLIQSIQSNPDNLTNPLTRVPLSDQEMWDIIRTYNTEYPNIIQQPNPDQDFIPPPFQITPSNILLLANALINPPIPNYISRLIKYIITRNDDFLELATISTITVLAHNPDFIASGQNIDDFQTISGAFDEDARLTNITNLRNDPMFIASGQNIDDFQNGNLARNEFLRINRLRVISELAIHPLFIASHQNIGDFLDDMMAREEIFRLEIDD